MTNMTMEKKSSDGEGEDNIENSGVQEFGRSSLLKIR